MKKNQHAVLTATVFHDYDGVTRAIKYRTAKELMHSIFLLLTDAYKGSEDVHGDNVRVDLAGGKRFYWNDTIAHYCFARGRISEKDAFNMMTN